MQAEHRAKSFADRHVEHRRRERAHVKVRVHQGVRRVVTCQQPFERRCRWSIPDRIPKSPKPVRVVLKTGGAQQHGIQILNAREFGSDRTRCGDKGDGVPDLGQTPGALDRDPVAPALNRRAIIEDDQFHP